MTATVARPKLAIIAKRAVGSAMPRSLLSNRSRRWRSAPIVAIEELIDRCGGRLSDGARFAPCLDTRPTRFSSGRGARSLGGLAGELLDSARPLAAGGEHQLEVVRAGGVVEGDLLGDL